MSASDSFFPAAVDATGNNRGLGLYAEDTSVIFPVSATVPPTFDTTPPVLLTNDPQAASIVPPDYYSSGHPFSRPATDNRSAINTAGNVTFIQVQNPQGGLAWAVFSSTNGGGLGTVQVNFTPFTPVIGGGAYTMTIPELQLFGLCMSKAIITVQDPNASVGGLGPAGPPGG